MRFALDTPLWLLALPLAALVPLLARHHVRQAHRIAVWLRTAAVVALVLALAGPRVGFGSRSVDVVFLVDSSASMGAAGDEALSWVTEALGAKDDDDRAALALFGRDAALAHSLRSDPPAGPPAVVVDESATDLEQALRLGQAAAGREHRRRVVLLTDGGQTVGDVVRGAEDLVQAGVGLDVVRLGGGPRQDVLVDGVDAPSRVRDGEAYDVVVRLRNTGTTTTNGVLVVRAEGGEVARRTVELPPGESTVAIAREADGSGTVRYEATLESGASTVPENDAAAGAVRVDGPPSVLVYAGPGTDVAPLSTALTSAGVPTDVVDADDAPLPALDVLLEHDTVVLADVPAANLGEQGMATLQAYVRDVGHGLVTTGGDQSYGLGDYDGTPLEDLLPVYAALNDPRRRPPVAEALVVDTSESMGACHCADGEALGGGPIEKGGVNKTDISREAVSRAIAALEEQDTVGVLAFDSGNKWVVPLQQLPSQQVVDDGLAQLTPKGETNIDQAVREAIAGLQDTDARLRHIVLFTDGFTEDNNYADVAREAVEAGMTLSVVATGEGPPEFQRELQRMAEIGGGRYYPGRDLSSIPEILATEVRLAVRPTVNEGSFLPVVTATVPATEQLAATPPLLGYVATTSRPTAQTALRIGDERDPLLASWRAGLGHVTSWTSDVSPRWSAAWVDWEGYQQFWSDVVKDTFPAEEDLGGTVEASTVPGGVRVRVELADDAPADAAATVTLSSGDEVVEAPLDRVEPGAFEAVVPDGELGPSGVYAATAQVTAGGTTLYRGATTASRSYPAEYSFDARDTDATLQQALTVADGRLDPQPATVFDPAGLEAGERTGPLWPGLALLALALVVADVAFRRLRLEREDWDRLQRWLRRRRSDGPPVDDRDAETDALLAAKRRAR